MAPNRSITPQLLKVGKQYQEVGYSEKIRGYVTFEYLTCPISQYLNRFQNMAGLTNLLLILRYFRIC